MKFKPLHGVVTIKKMDDLAIAKTYEDYRKNTSTSFRCGEVVTVGYEDVRCFTNDAGMEIVQKVPMILKPGDLVLFRSKFAVDWEYKGETFCTVPQRYVEIVIEND